MNEKMINEKDYMRTSDLALVVALSLYFPVEAIDKDKNGKAYFIFRRDNDGFDDVLKQYWSRTLSVEPQAFWNQIKAIKARIYSEK